MMGPPPQVSVVIAAHCAARTLSAAVTSALAQTGVTVEVIIIDDASPDDTFARARALAADPRVTALQTARNGGPAVARNLALGRARAPWIAVLDADDTMSPDRIAPMLTLATRVGADILLGNVTLVDGPRRKPLLTPDRPVRWTLRDYLRGNRAAANAATFGYLKPLIRREFLVSHGLTYDPSLRNGEDFHLVVASLAAGGRVWFSPAPDYHYTRRPGSVSHRADPAHLRALSVADRAAAMRQTDPVARRLLCDRARANAHLATAEAAFAALRNRAPLRAVTALLRDPAALPRFARQGAAALRHRLQP